MSSTIHTIFSDKIYEDLLELGMSLFMSDISPYFDVIYNVPGMLANYLIMTIPTYLSLRVVLQSFRFQINYSFINE